MHIKVTNPKGATKLALDWYTLLLNNKLSEMEAIAKEIIADYYQAKPKVKRKRTVKEKAEIIP